MRATIDNTISDPLNLPTRSEFLLWLKEKTSSQNFISFAIVLSAHLTLLLAIFAQKQMSAQPVLSFTVTMMDISSSSNNVVATAASIASNSNSKAQNEIRENKNESLMAQASQKEILEENSQEKNKAAQSHNSSAQNAVIAPTQKAIFDAAYLHNEAPTYPPLSRQFEEEGTVILSVFVDAQGKAQEVKINKSSGYSRLDNAASKTVAKWKFIAAKNGAQSMSSWVQVPVKFVLEN